jgi:hypothetical protein
LDYEFKNLENLIRRAITTGATKKGGNVSAVNLTVAISNERCRLEHCFDLKVLDQTSEEERRRFIQFHQFSLSRLINDSFKVLKLQHKKHYQEAIIENIVSLFQFIAGRYYQYLDLSYNAPNAITEKTLSSELDQKAGLENSIDSIVTDTELREFCKDLIHLPEGESHPTLGKLLFGVEARRRFGELLQRVNVSDIDVDDKIRNELLRLNFNSDKFHDHYVQNIINKLVKLDSDRDRYELLALHLKVISQLQVDDSISFVQNKIPIKQSVSEWIAEEMNFIEAKIRLSLIAITKGSESALGDFKLTLDLSVAQLALLTKSFVETGVIQNKNISELIRFLSRFAITKKSGSVSQESLRIKYYNVETGTKESIRNMLHTAIGYINKN